MRKVVPNPLPSFGPVWTRDYLCQRVFEDKILLDDIWETLGGVLVPSHLAQRADSISSPPALHARLKARYFDDELVISKYKSNPPAMQLTPYRPLTDPDDN